MKPVPHVLECDLLIEHQGRQLRLEGSGGEFIARFPTLASLVHFVPLGWAYRRSLPAKIAVQVKWKNLSFRVQSGRWR